jgi:hypothetical protein
MASNLAQVVGTLLDSATDEDEAVEESVKQALCEIGSARPQAVLSASLRYIEATPNIKEHHRIRILKAVQGVIERGHSSLDMGQTGRLSTFACEEVLKGSKLESWESAACDILVALSHSNISSVMEDLTSRVSSGEVPHGGIILALTEVARNNQKAFVPYFTKILSRLLPNFGAMQKPALQFRVASALNHFSDAVIYEESQQGGEQASSFSSRSATVASALNALASTWMIQSRDALVRGSSAEAVGSMSRMIDDEQLDQSFAFIIGHIVSLLKRERSDSQARLGLTRGLVLLLTRAKTMAESHLAELLEVLHPLACHPIDYSIPLTNRVRTELLRSIEALASTFPAKVIQFLVTTLDVPKPSLQVGTCVILKHLVNATTKEITDAGMREHLISGVLKLLSVNDLEVRGAFAQLIVAMGKAGFLTMGGGRELVLFVVQQCAIGKEEIIEWEKNQKGWFSKGGSGTSPAQLRAGCERFVDALGQCAEKAVWPLLFTALIPAEYKDSLTPVTKCLCQVATNSNTETLKALVINSDVPKTSELFARLIVLSSCIIAKDHMVDEQPCSNSDLERFKEQGWNSLDLLNALGPIFDKNISKSWSENDTMRKLETMFKRSTSSLNINTNDEKKLGSVDFSYDSIEDVFASKKCNPIAMLMSSLPNVPGNWLADVGDALIKHIENGMYDNDRILKASAYVCLGTLISSMTGAERPRKWIAEMLKSVNHFNMVERNGLAIGLGMACGRKGSHVDMVLQAIAGVIRDDTVVKSSGWFGGGSERSEDECDAIKGTMLLALGYCTKFAPLQTLSSRVEAHVASHFQAALEKMRLTKVDLRDCVLRGLIEISRAIGKKGSNLQLSMRDDTLNTISSWVYELLNKKKIDTEVSGVTCSLVLEACAGLVAVVPKPDNNVIAGVLGNILIIVESPFEDDNVDVIQPLTMFFQSCVTVCANKDVLELLFFSYPGQESETNEESLFAWTNSEAAFQRYRSVKVICNTLETYLKLNNELPVEKLLFVLLPRVMDSEKDVRTAALNSVNFVTKNSNTGGDGGVKNKQRKNRMVNASSLQRFAEFKVLAKLCVENVSPARLTDDTETIGLLLRGLNDVDPASSCAASEVLYNVFKLHGANLQNIMQTMLGDEIDEGVDSDEKINSDTKTKNNNMNNKKRANEDESDIVRGALVRALDGQLKDIDGNDEAGNYRMTAKNTTLSAIRALASYHFKPFVNILLNTILPYHEAVKEIFVALSMEKYDRVAAGPKKQNELESSMLENLVEHLTLTLNDAAPGNDDEPSLIVPAAHRAFEILFNSVGQEITIFIDQQFCPLICTLLLSIGSVNCALSCDGMENSSAIDALKQLFIRACADSLIEKMEELKDEYDDESSLERQLANSNFYDNAISEIMVGLSDNDYCNPEKVFLIVQSFLTSPNGGQRVAASAICCSLILISVQIVDKNDDASKKSMDLLKNLIKAVLARATDSEAKARKHAFKALGELGKCKNNDALLPAMPTILNVLSNGLDDEAIDVKIEALRSMSILISTLPESQIVPILMNICFRVQNVFTVDDENVRKLGFEVLKIMCKFRGKTSGNFEEQSFVLLPSVLMHLKSPFEVSTAALSCLNELINLLGKETNTLKQIIDDHTSKGYRGNIIDDFDPFISTVTKKLTSLHPNRAEAWVSKSNQLVQNDSEWSDSRGSIAMILGSFVASLPNSIRSRVGVGPVCTSLVKLLESDDASVRARGALALSLLKDL